MDRGIFDPQQFARQLSDLLCHLTPATLQSSGVMQASVTTMAATTTSDNQPPPTTSTPLLSTSNQLPPTLPLTTNQQVDEVLSAASPIQLLSPTTVNNQTALLNCTLPPTLPTLPALINQPATITDNPADVSIHTKYLPSVPPKVRARIIKGEYINLLPCYPRPCSLAVRCLIVPPPLLSSCHLIVDTFQFAQLQNLKVSCPQIRWKRGTSTLLFALTI